MRGIAKGRALAVMFIMLGALLAGTSLLPLSRAAVLFVGGAGPGNYTTIQAGIDAASNGDTVYVFSGTYNESVSVWKGVSLIGERRETTVVDGGGREYGIRLRNGHVMGFTVRNSISGLLVGWGCVNDCRVTDNILTGNHNGISVDSSENVMIANNTAFSNFNGILIEGSEWVSIKNNTFYDIEEAAIIACYSGRVDVARNTITSSIGGIEFWGSDDSSIVANAFHGNYWGIQLRSSVGTTVVGNTFSENGFDVYSYFGSNRNAFYHNSFIRQDGGSCSDGDLDVWDNGYPSGGNYWSYYDGTDEMSGPNQDEPGSDGIGDIPHFVPACNGPPEEGIPYDDHEDRFPLMESVVPGLPSAPLNLRASVVHRSIVLEWQPPLFDGGSPITNYSVYRGTAPGAGTFLAETGNVLTYTDSEVTIGRTYYYTVSAKNTNGEGPKSNEASATVPRAIKPPLDLIRVPGIENTSLNWKLPGGGGDGSRICQVPGGGMSFLRSHSPCELEGSTISTLHVLERLPKRRGT